MMKKTLILGSVIFIGLVMNSCRATRINIATSELPASTNAYIDKYRNLAISEMKRTGVPASIKLAQGILESGYGRSRLAVEANNHFGIKCHNGWTGPTIRHHDDARNECFRKYSSAEESFLDHSDFLKNTPRYRFLFDLDPSDYKGWARGLKKAGFATNPDYAEMLIRKIEEYALYEYDRVALSGKLSGKTAAVTKPGFYTDRTKELTESNSGKINYSAGKTVQERILENNRIKYIIVNEGETRESLEKELKLLKWELERYNEMEENFEPEPGQILYIQPKRKKAEPGKEVHRVQEGETMYIISQKYGIKMKYLYYYNRMDESKELLPGQDIWLRRLKPVY